MPLNWIQKKVALATHPMLKAARSLRAKHRYAHRLERQERMLAIYAARTPEYDPTLVARQCRVLTRADG
jgi:hypothetical protein